MISNLLQISFEEMNKLGYKQVSNLDLENDDLLAATKDLNTWIIVQDAKYLKKYLNNHHIIYRKFNN